LSFKKRFDLEDTISTVLYHEIVLYNSLLNTIRQSLESVERGLKGEIIFDEKLEKLKIQILAGKVPELWLDKSYSSILNLNRYIDDLNMRVEFLSNWVNDKKPITFNLGAFYHPEEFLTGILQVYARKHIVAFDSLAWKTELMPIDFKPTEEPEEGIYIEGLPIEGAKWDQTKGTLVECAQRELENYLPIIHLLPTQDKTFYDSKPFYECPIFRTQTRGTGALDLPNYIISLFIPSSEADHWIQRSVAAFITIQ